MTMGYNQPVSRALHESSKIFVQHAECCLLLGYSFEPRPNNRAFGTEGSVTTIGLSINGYSLSKNQFDERKQG